MQSFAQSLGLLLLRLGVGGIMLLAHGWPKLAVFTEYAKQFPDPLGVGATVSLGLAIFAEVCCSVLIIAGISTRLACIPLIVTMAVAAFVIHARDPWMNKELAVLFLLIFSTLLVTGAGWFSIDRILGTKWRQRRPVTPPAA